MDLKKILALVMVALMALPSLTMTVGADDGAGMAGAIERAHLYLDKVRASADNLADEYPDNEIIQGYYNQIYELLGQGGEEGPEFTLGAGTFGTAESSDVTSHSGDYSVHLETTGTPGDGDEARIVIPMPEGFTLGELETLSWWENLTTGYPPHVDVFLNFTGDSDPDDVLVFEYAYNNMTHYDEAPAPYGALTGSWYRTFSDDGNGPTRITNSSVAWLNSGSPGPDAWVNHTLADWKDGITVAAGTIDADSIVIRLEIEVDNWIVQTEAYVDDIVIDGVGVYDFEEKLETLGAEGLLNQASVSLGEGQFNSTARYLASARNILGRVNGLLTSMAKAHKVARTDRFMRQLEHRIEGLEDKVDRLRGRLGEGANTLKASMGVAKGKLRQLNLSGNNVDLDELENTTEIIAEGFEELEEEETSNNLEAIDRLEAKVRVLKASAERLSRKGYDTTAVVDELEGAEALLKDVVDLLDEGKMEEAESLIEEIEDLVSGISGEIRVIGKQQNKDSKGRGKGQGS